MNNLKEVYLKYIKDNGYSFDKNQMKLVEILNLYKNQLEANHSFFNKFINFFIGTKSPKKFLKGIYVWGDVGRGKSMIMNLFFDNLKINNKQRFHFHKFMNIVHSELETMRRNNFISDNYVKSYAQGIANVYKILYLDELQINNIADAMIVERLFKYLIEFKVFVIFTSNRVPNDLFKDGLQRERFFPFIKLINNDFEIFHLDNFKDYRLIQFNNKLYFYPLNDVNNKKIKDIILQLTGHEKLNQEEITIYSNRVIKVNNCYGKLAIFEFDELCNENLGTVDYIALCKKFDFFIIKNIPVLLNDNHNEALRFITLIDCIYESHSKLICLSEMEPSKIYSGEKNKFEFQRTISRLNEMQSQKYFNSK